MPQSAQSPIAEAGRVAAQTPDRVDEVLRLWQEEYPQRDTRAMAVLLRIARINRDITRALSIAVSTAVSSVDTGTFAVLLLLRISGAPFEASPSWLADMMQIYPNHLSNLLDRLKSNGLIERRRDPSDRRRVVVRLTPAGVEAIEQAFTAHFDVERELVEPLDAAEMDDLARLLRKLVLFFEGPPGSGGRRPSEG